MASVTREGIMEDRTKPENRRRLTRFPVFLESNLQVPLPDEGGAVFASQAVVEDLTPLGARLCIDPFDRWQAPALQRVPREGSLRFQLPGTHETCTLQGNILWADIRFDETHPRAWIGMEFRGPGAEERERVRLFLKKIAPWVV
jgi:hypothetical protein